MSTYERLLVPAWQQLENATQARKRGHGAYAARCLIRAGELRRKAAAIYRHAGFVEV